MAAEAQIVSARLGSLSPLVEVEHITRVIESRAGLTVILDDLSFNVPTGALFAVNGPSGSGKSTLLNLLTGIDRPTTGRIVFEGQELRARSEDDLARWRGRHVGIIFQSFQLIATLTAFENVLLALELGPGAGLPRDQWRRRAQDCLRTVDLTALGHRLPSELSGGQQQRVAIARALANDPPVIVADEPTGNLDSRAAQSVFETLAGLVHHGRTVVYVTHDRQLAARATSGIELLDGRIVAEHDVGTMITGS